MNEKENNPQKVILLAIRDNLLKPMAEEICRKQKEQSEKISARIVWLFILTLFSLCFNAFVICYVLSR